MEKFCKLLPKIELHAHLNGSLSRATLIELGCNEENVREYQKLTTIFEKTTRTLDDCFTLFSIAHNVTNTTHAIYKAATSVIQEFHVDNCIYLELRTTPRSGPNMTYEEYVLAVIKAIQDNKLTIIVKLILCLNRNLTKTQNEELFSVICSMHEQHNDIIVGIDLCGNPNMGYFPKKEFAKARNCGLKITLHCGEINADEEVKEMVEFMPDRIGHGTFVLPRKGIHDLAFDIYRLSAIPLEICLTSNVVTGTVSNYASHHLKEWMEYEFPFSLCTDDKGVFDSDLSNEYYLSQKFNNLTCTNLYNISYRAVDYIFGSDNVKTKLRAHLNLWKNSNAHFFSNEDL